MNLIERQKDISKTILPDRILYKESQTENRCEYSLLGCRIKYFDTSTTLSYLDAPLNRKIIILEELMECLKELLDNYIYPIDLHIDNVLFDDQIRIIDLDTLTTTVSNFEDKEKYTSVLKRFRKVLLCVLFNYQPYLSFRDMYFDLYYSQNLSRPFFYYLTNENFNFEDANSLIYFLKKQKNCFK